MKRILGIIGTVFLISAAVWAIGYSTFFNYRIPADWSYKARFLGHIASADEQGNVPPKRDVVVYQRDQAVVDWSPAKAVIEDIYTVLDAKTGAVVWQSKRKFPLNPKTGQMVESSDYPHATGFYFLLPQHLEKKNYHLFTYYLANYDVHFDRVDAVEGMEAYVYKFRGDLDVTDSYVGTDEYPGVHPPPGQIIKSYGLVNELWVDPATGELLKFKEGSDADAYADEQTGTLVKMISTWGGVTTMDTNARAAKYVSSLHFINELNTRWIPGGLAVIGIGLLIVSLRWRRA